jgi:hypothetical protein
MKFTTFQLLALVAATPALAMTRKRGSADAERELRGGKGKGTCTTSSTNPGYGHILETLKSGECVVDLSPQGCRLADGYPVFVYSPNTDLEIVGCCPVCEIDEAILMQNCVSVAGFGGCRNGADPGFGITFSNNVDASANLAYCCPK